MILCVTMEFKYTKMHIKYVTPTKEMSRFALHNITTKYFIHLMIFLHA